MQNITGLLLRVGTWRPAKVIAAVRTAFLAAGYEACDAGPDTLHVRIGASVGGVVLVTDSTRVTFDEGVARAVVAAVGPGALFAVRDHGYRKGRRVQRAAFVALDPKWKARPKRATHVDDVYFCVLRLGLWPEPWALETRAGKSLHFRLAPTSRRFPPRDTAALQADARALNDAGMLLDLPRRRAEVEQWPPTGPCATLHEWLPAPLPPHAEAVIACVSDEALRARAWVRLVDAVWCGTLTLDVRTARLLRALRTTPPGPAEVERHPSYQRVEHGVAWLLARLAGAPEPTLDDAARLAAAHVALEHDQLELLAGVDLPALGRALLNDADVHRAAHAAALLAVVEPASLPLVETRARADATFAQTVGVHGTLSLARHFPAATLRLLDAVQPSVKSDGHGGWCHATALWLTWTRLGRRPKEDVDAPDRIATRLALAHALAGTHDGAMQNARVLSRALAKRPGARSRAAETKRAG